MLPVSWQAQNAQVHEAKLSPPLFHKVGPPAAKPHGLCYPTKTWRWQPPQWVRRAEHWTKENYPRVLRSNANWHAMFWTFLGPSPLPSYFSLLEWDCLMLFHYCILEAHNVFGFTGSQLERNFALGWVILQVSPTFDLMVFRWEFVL